MIALVIADWRGTRRSCPDIWSLLGRACRADNAINRLYRAGLGLVRPHAVQWPAIPRARRHRSRKPPRAGQHDAGPVHHLAQQPRLRRTPMPHRRPGCSLARHWLAARAHTRQEARRSSPERTAPAIGGSRSVRTGGARQPGLLCTPRGSPVRTDHTSHSSPATCRSAVGPRCPARCHIDSSLLLISFPGSAALWQSGTAARSRAGPRGIGRRRAWRRGAPAADSAGSGAGRTTRAPSASPPPPIQSGRLPCQIRAWP